RPADAPPVGDGHVDRARLGRGGGRRAPDARGGRVRGARDGGARARRRRGRDRRGGAEAVDGQAGGARPGGRPGRGLPRRPDRPARAGEAGSAADQASRGSQGGLMAGGGPSGIDEAELLRRVVDDFGIAATRLTREAEGEEAWRYVAWDGAGERAFVKV